MTALAQLITELMGLGLEGDRLIAAVTIFEHHLSRDGRDAKQKAADRSARYRQRKRDASVTAERDGGVTKRDDALLLSSSLLSESPRATEKVREKKERKKPARALPNDWQPNLSHIEAAKKLGRNEQFVFGKAEDMRIWARSNDVRKVDWDQVFHGFLRRDEPAFKRNGFHGGHDDRPTLASAVDDLVARTQNEPELAWPEDGPGRRQGSG